MILNQDELEYNTSVRFAFLLIMSCNTIGLCMVTHDIYRINWLVAIDINTYIELLFVHQTEN
jgi:hypothetical protein